MRLGRSLRLARFTPAQAAVLRLLVECARGRAVYLVGGTVRDALLGRPGGDLDLAVPAGGCALARALAEHARGAYVELDATRGTGRAVLRVGGSAIEADVADFRAPTLEADLAGRDFTANALAAAVPRLVEAGSAPVIDPLGGLADLAARRLRLAGRQSIAADPARALRGIRLEAELGLSLDEVAARAIRAGASGLARVAAERVTQELVAMLRLPESASALRRALSLRVLMAVIPELAPMRGVSQPAPHRFDVLEHSLRAVAGVDRLVARMAALAPWTEVLTAHLAEALGGGLSRREVLRLAALLHDVAKPETRALVAGRVRFFGHDVRGAERARAIGGRLRLPGAAAGVLERLVRHHLRLMHLEQVPVVTRRARYRFFRDLGDDARDLLLLALADAAAVTGVSPLLVWRRSRLVHELMAGVAEDAIARSAPPLLRGEDVMEAFGLTPGPAVGRLLALAREAQDLGLVRTREEALGHLRAIGGGRAGLPPTGPPVV